MKVIKNEQLHWDWRWWWWFDIVRFSFSVSFLFVWWTKTECCGHMMCASIWSIDWTLKYDRTLSKPISASFLFLYSTVWIYFGANYRDTCRNSHRPNVNNSLINGSVVRFISAFLFIILSLSIPCFDSPTLFLWLFCGYILFFLYFVWIRLALHGNGKQRLEHAFTFNVRDIWAAANKIYCFS